MLVTTTPTVEGYPVTQYLRVVCGETIAGVNAFDIDYETLGSDNGMLMVTASGTAVRFSR